MRVLIADDQDFNRKLIGAYVSQNGHTVIEASNGLEACRSYEAGDVDLVFLDINMPEMNGYEACRVIKAAAGDGFIPIIFVTSSVDEATLAQCLAVGGDDFITKPISELTLVSKLRAHQRTLDLFNSLQSTNQSLLYHTGLIEHEHRVVESIFNNSLKRIDTRFGNVRYHVSPMSMFNGDLLLIAPSPSGGMYILLGDFTGHGLSAAIGGLPASDIFYSMAANGTSVGDIATALNDSLLELLPENMFFCAALMNLNSEGDRITLWMGGMNDILLIDESGRIDRHLTSKHMPLGILDSSEFQSTADIVCLNAGQRLYAFTDGVIEANNPRGELFGEERLHEILESNSRDMIGKIINAVTDFQGDECQSDDLSIIELQCGPITRIAPVESASETASEEPQPAEHRALPWQISLTLGVEQLRQPDVVDQIVKLLAGIEGIQSHKDLIYTVISELYSNALEHGLLKLDSREKSNADGYSSYYRKREQRLTELDSGYIQVCMSVNFSSPVRLTVAITDSGQGFNPTQAFNQSDDKLYYGRGLKLVQSLCETLVFDHGGRTALATYVIA